MEAEFKQKVSFSFRLQFSRARFFSSFNTKLGFDTLDGSLGGEPKANFRVCLEGKDLRLDPDLLGILRIIYYPVTLLCGRQQAVLSEMALS